MDNPTTNGNYTKEDVRDYAYFRKATEMARIETVLEDKRIGTGEISLEEHEEYREPLAILKNIVITIELSTGGDADGFKITLDKYHHLDSGVYYWADWGVYEEVSLSDEELDIVDHIYCISSFVE